MTFEEILEAIQAHNQDLSVDEFAYGDFETPEEVGEFDEIEQVGGEGGGDVWYSVFHFPKHDIYVRTDGFYSSYDGTTFDGWEDVKEVKPKEKTIIVYE